MPRTTTMEKHTDEMILDGRTGKWSRRERTINDNVCHGGDWWTTQGAEGIVNAEVVGAIILPKADTPFEEKPSAVQDKESSGSKTPIQGSKEVHRKGSSKPKNP